MRSAAKYGEAANAYGVKRKVVLGASKALHGLARDVEHGHVGSLIRQPLETADDSVALEHFHLNANQQGAKKLEGGGGGEGSTLSMMAGYSGTTMYLPEMNRAACRVTLSVLGGLGGRCTARCIRMRGRSGDRQ